MFEQLLAIIFPIVAIVGVGFMYGRRHAPDMAAANRINIDIFVPALLFDVLTSKSFALVEYQELALAGVFVVLGSALLAYPVSRLLGYQTKTFVPPMMFNNSGNMGLPLALFAFGERALPAAVVLFIIENSLHFSVGTRILDRTASVWGMFKVPMILATILGILVSYMEWHVPETLAVPINMLGQVSIPLMLFALGVRLIDIDWRQWRIGLVGALVAPLSGLLFALPLVALLPLPDEQWRNLIVFAALPPAVLNYMVAEKYQQEPHLVAAIVMMGNVGSLLIIPAVLAFLI